MCILPDRYNGNGRMFHRIRSRSIVVRADRLQARPELDMVAEGQAIAIVES